MYKYEIKLENSVNGFAHYGIIIDNNKVYVHHIKGRMLELPEVLYAILSTKRGCRAMKEGLGYLRKNPYMVKRRDSMSGSKDYTLMVAEQAPSGMHRVRPAARLHISMYGKVNDQSLEKGMFIPDFIELASVYLKDIADFSLKEALLDSIYNMKNTANRELKPKHSRGYYFDEYDLRDQGFTFPTQA